MPIDWISFLTGAYVGAALSGFLIWAFYCNSRGAYER
jgi:hypothetical protein